MITFNPQIHISGDAGTTGSLAVIVSGYLRALGSRSFNITFNFKLIGFNQTTKPECCFFVAGSGKISFPANNHITIVGKRT